MPGREDSQKVDLQEVSSNLSEGLRTCRSVLRGYRSLLVGDPAATTPAAVNDDGPRSEAEMGSSET